MDGLIVKQPYADMLIDGTKMWELRNRHPPKNKVDVDIFLLSRCYSLGIIHIVKSTGPLSIAELNNNNDRHRSGIGWPTDTPPTYAWHIHTIERFTPPKKYSHPNGAQIWVKDVTHSKPRLTDYIDN